MTVQADGWKTWEQTPERPGTYLVQIPKAGGGTMTDRLCWTGKQWVRNPAKEPKGGNLFCNVEGWKPEDAAETWEDAADARKDGAAAAALTAQGAAETGLTIRDYEARIHLYKEQIGTGYIGIGRTLNEAKAAGVVPHGEWEAWVTRVTGLTPRQAQRCMQAATEIRDGSALARIEMSKALMLLSSGLDEETREGLAGKAVSEGATVKQLKAEIDELRRKQAASDEENAKTVKALKRQVVESAGATEDIRQKLRNALQQRADMEIQMKAVKDGMTARMRQEVDRAYKRGRTETAAEQEKTIRQEFQGKITFLNSKREKLEAEKQELTTRLNRANRLADPKWDEGFQSREAEILALTQKIQAPEDEIRKNRQDAADAAEDRRKAMQNMEAEAIAGAAAEKDREIAELRAELEAAEAREAKRAAELKTLREEKTRNGMDAARGIGAETMGAMDLTQAVREFIGRVGSLPQMGGMISGMPEKDREGIRIQVDTVARWVEGARTALGATSGEYFIV